VSRMRITNPFLSRRRARLHGQSEAVAGKSDRGHLGHARQSWPVDKFSAARAGIPATIYVPHGNSADQNAAAVVEFGRDFDEALAECHRVHVRVAVCRQVARRATHRSIGANTMARTSEKSPKIAKEGRPPSRLPQSRPPLRRQSSDRQGRRRRPSAGDLTKRIFSARSNTVCQSVRNLRS
jgi:hypothetical protein